MPISTVNVYEVRSLPTAKPGCTSHIVDTDGGQFFTLNDLKASLCKRAGEMKSAAVIHWKDGRRNTKDIVFVEIAA